MTTPQQPTSTSCLFKEMQKDNHFDFRIWKQRRNISSENIFTKINKNVDTIKHDNALLNGERHSNFYTKKKYKRKNVKTEYTRSSSTQNLHMISNTARKILSIANQNIKEMKSKTNHIMKMNSVYLEQFLHQNKNYYQKVNNSSNSLPPLKRNNSFIHNFDYVNDNYRRQLNKAFLLYNPYIHLENLYLLQQADSSIKDDIDRVRNNVNEDLKEITDKKYYRKRYKQLIAKNRKENKTNTEVSEEKTSGETKTSNANKYIGYLNKQMNADVKRKFPKREIRAKERKLTYIYYIIHIYI